MKIPTFSKDLGGFLLRDTLDLLQDSTRGVGDGLHGVVAAINNKLNVALGQAGNSLYTKG